MTIKLIAWSFTGDVFKVEEVPTGINLTCNGGYWNPESDDKDKVSLRYEDSQSGQYHCRVKKDDGSEELKGTIHVIFRSEYFDI